MEIAVNSKKKLSEIQNEFHSKFPFLKIEFFKRAHDHNVGSARSGKLEVNQTISEAGHFDHDEAISIDGHLKVSTLEDHFQDLYGIGVQVFRKAGKIWIQTTATDDWTLANQNEEGMGDS